jgi:hypothetical protein
VRTLQRRCLEEEVFFFEKKNQKTFIPLRTLPASYTPSIKSFLLLFFKKEDSFFTASEPPPHETAPRANRRRLIGGVGVRRARVV